MVALGTRIGFSTDPQVVADLVRAVDAVAARCDEMSDRLQQLQATVDDLSGTLGEEVARMRAVLERRDLQTAPEPPATAQ